MLWLVLYREAATWTLPQRKQVAGVLEKHRANVLEQVANLLAVAGDVTALLEQVGPVGES